MRYLIFAISLTSALIWFSFHGDKLLAEPSNEPIVLYKNPTASMSGKTIRSSLDNITEIAATVYCTSKGIMDYLRSETMTKPVLKSIRRFSNGSARIHFLAAGQNRLINLSESAGCVVTQFDN